jgi:hypothetical protein
VSQAPRLERYHELLSFSYWSVAKLLGYGVFPMLHIALRGGRLGEFGLALGGASAVDEKIRLPWARMYLILLCGILPLVFAVSFSQSFQQNYPFYRQASRSCLRLCGVGSGVPLDLRRRRVLLSRLPTVRPASLPGEPGAVCVDGAVLSDSCLEAGAGSDRIDLCGALLGTLALCTGSLWAGVLLHVSVALSMDVLASWQSGRLPHLW